MKPLVVSDNSHGFGVAFEEAEAALSGAFCARAGAATKTAIANAPRCCLESHTLNALENPVLSGALMDLRRSHTSQRKIESL